MNLASATARQLCKHRSQADVNQLGVTAIPVYASEIAVGFAIAFGAISLDPPRYPVVRVGRCVLFFTKDP